MAATASALPPAPLARTSPQLLSSQSATPPQLAPVATGLLMGQVVDSHGAGVAGAMVTLRGGFETVALTTQVREIPGGARGTLASDDGRFVFFNLPAGSYSIEAVKPGFMPGAYGRRRFGGPAQSIALAEGEKNITVRIPMWEFASITGRVVDDLGEPAVNVQVRALRRVADAGRPRWTAQADATAVFSDVTDDRGEYRLDRLVPGEYLVAIDSSHVTLPAAMVDQYQAERPSGVPPVGAINLFSSQVLRAGLPMTGPMYRTADWALAPSARTSMTLPSSGADGRMRVHPTVFYPAARTPATASILQLAAGDDRPGVDMQLPLVPTSVLTGTITGVDGPLPGLTLSLMPAYADEIADERLLEAARGVTNGAGQFAFLAVPPGSYVIRAHAAPGTGIGVELASSLYRGASINQAVVVPDAPSVNTNVAMKSGARVTGRVVFDGALPQPTPERMARYQVRLDPVDANAQRSPALHIGRVDRDGNFTIEEVPHGRYLVLFQAFLEDRRAMPGWETKGATLGGRDVATRPMQVGGDVSGVVVTITDRPSQLAGAVKTADGRVDPDAAVIMFSAERELWLVTGSSNRRFRAVRAAEDGTYLFRGVPAGEYFLAAVADEDSLNWLTPERLERLARVAMGVTIRDEEKKSLDLTTRKVER